MMAELATFALVLALALALLAALSLVTARCSSLTEPSAQLACFLVFAAFVALLLLRVDSDFTVLNVATHSNRDLPLLYKIAGAWGNHEGSMLLFALVMAGCGAMLGGRACSVQSLLLAGVLLFILLTSNPFARLFPPPADGQMLNPLLQDLALALHPPLLYVGYVGFSAVFSRSIAGLWAGRIDREWAAASHAWIMTAWASLTVGIALGSWWAYRELGWGGFWFWDPVENASLLPWLAGTALLHANLVLKKRGRLASWVALLSILTFGLSLLGTFLVRSGVITSVHSFASDPARGLFILLYLGGVLGGGLFLFARRVGALPPSPPVRPGSREGVIVINNLFVLTACATVLLGTIYPMIVDALGGASVTVGPPYYHATFLPLMALPLLCAGLAPFVPWKKAAFASAFRRAAPAWMTAAATGILVMALVDQQAMLAAGSLALAGFLLVASGQWLAEGRWRYAVHWPVFLGHAGAALLILGITGAGLWSTQAEAELTRGDELSIAGYRVKLSAIDLLDTPNYHSVHATLQVMVEGVPVATLTPEARRYRLRETTTSEADIYATAAYDLYAVIGETATPERIALRLYHKPAIGFLWLGAAFMTVGGALAAWLSLRRRP